MKLELGAGYRPTPGFVHQDLNNGPDIEIIGDARYITRHQAIGPESCDEIRATHLLEHFPHTDTVDVLKEWYAALKPGGTIWIEVPHIFGHVLALYRGEITNEQFIVYVYGEQDFAGNAHFAGFDPVILATAMAKAGFRDIDIQDIGMVLNCSACKPVEGKLTQ